MELSLSRTNRTDAQRCVRQCVLPCRDHDAELVFAGACDVDHGGYSRPHATGRLSRTTINMVVTKKKLNVALLLEDMSVPAWTYKCIEKITEMPDISIKVIFLNPVPPQNNKNIFCKLFRNRSFFVYKLLTSCEKKIFGNKPDPFAIMSIEELCESVPRIQLHPRQTTVSDVYNDESVSDADQIQIDVCLNFCHRIQRGRILQIARFGVWSLHHGDAERYRGGPPGFWETVERSPVVGTTLQILSENLDGGSILARSWSAIDPTSLSRSHQRLFWKSSQLMPRALSRLLRDENSIKKNDAAKFVYSGPLYKPPKNLRATSIFFVHSCRSILRRANHVFTTEQWQLLYCDGGGLPHEMRLMKSLVPPSSYLWADPMVIDVDSKTFVFFEEMRMKTEHGHISVIEYCRKEKKFGEVKQVLKRPYHLSYPYVFMADGRFWMIPETSANRQIELYIAEEFPCRWKLYKVLMKGCDCVDATLHFHNDKWWMFVGLASIQGASSWEETFLFYSDHFSSDQWKSHPSNPIVSDVRRSRPAGPILVQGSQLIRPSQDCSLRYGYGLRLNAIECWNETEYLEKELTHITPDWRPNIVGVHHISMSDYLTMMDVNVRKKRGFAS